MLPSYTPFDSWIFLLCWILYFPPCFSQFIFRIICPLFLFLFSHHPDPSVLSVPLRGCAAAPSALSMMPFLRPRVDLGHMYPLINSPPCSRLSSVYRVPVPGSLARKYGANCRSKLVQDGENGKALYHLSINKHMALASALRKRFRIYRLDAISRSLGSHTGWVRYWLLQGATPCLCVCLGRKGIIANFNMKNSLLLTPINARHL